MINDIIFNSTCKSMTEKHPFREQEDLIFMSCNNAVIIPENHITVIGQTEF